ncbi:hypothetical protein MIMGU_mgv11b014854mg [Erythranthe guttata]|uniref:Uncharacterized protein n=1 Tax=Erythranthe guttata TaxID=4155 RepID=A0A022QAD7_ERYGU|nr:hypothetical protein MIMGU_mgv11b014854mg [Erythranthe guttata]
MGDPLGSPRVAPPPHIFLVFYPSLGFFFFFFFFLQNLSHTPCICLAKSSARTDRAEKFWGGRSIENARISPINVPFASETARERAKRTIFTSSVGSMGLRPIDTTTASERASRAYADCVVTPPESKVITV